jgi:nucleoside-triphosphatase
MKGPLALQGATVAGEEVSMGNPSPLRVLLEGRPGIGKTTVVRRLATLLRDAGVRLGGFVTDEIRAHGRREGFMVEALSGDRGVLAHVELPGPPRAGRYGVDLQTFERIALPALPSGGVAVVDELGKMELASAPFRDAVSALWDRNVAVVATVQSHHHPFTDAFKQRPDVQALRVTEHNRDALPDRLAARLHTVGAPGRAR